MTVKELYSYNEKYYKTKVQYKMVHWSDYDFSILDRIMYDTKPGKAKGNKKYNDCIIMADTETSKKTNDSTIIEKNHVCAWTISIRAYHKNICTLYGHKPTSLIECMTKIHKQLKGDRTIIYFHNLSYDWVFVRRFCFQVWGVPESQLNTKPHYPIFINFSNGITFKDSLILAQRKLEKWAKDLDVKHKKAVGCWDYDKIRNQNEVFTPDELKYIEHDTLAGVECINATMDYLCKHIYNMPYTATGIPREECRTRGQEYKAHDVFLRQALTLEQYLKAQMIFHGGYTHGNRHLINYVITYEEFNHYIKCYDFSSSYPFCMLAYKYPSESFSAISGKATIEWILEHSEEYAFLFKLVIVKPRLKNDFIPMPALQASKCVKSINSINDNGRVLCASYIEIYLNEIDLEVIASQYDYEYAICVEIESATKDYLPRWFTDYAFELYEQKCKLKNAGDPVAYAMAKAKLNSLYGMLCQKSIQDNIIEDYESGECTTEVPDYTEMYEKYLNNRNNIFNYIHGCYVTSYAFRNVHKLGLCCETWIYSDTDSCYGMNWDTEKVNAYNEECKRLLNANNYGCVHYNGREFWLGVAEHSEEEDTYTEFIVQGAKRYCGRHLDGKLSITVAGVPKKGVECLHNDINNFKKGLIFDGKTTGKLLHTYFFNDIYTDEAGNITGDSINLSPCDYLLDNVSLIDWENIFTEEINIQVYDEE